MIKLKLKLFSRSDRFRNTICLSRQKIIVEETCYFFNQATKMPHMHLELAINSEHWPHHRRYWSSLVIEHLFTLTRFPVKRGINARWFYLCIYKSASNATPNHIYRCNNFIAKIKFIGAS